jgi:hypothetical protein
MGGVSLVKSECYIDFACTVAIRAYHTQRHIGLNSQISLPDSSVMLCLMLLVLRDALSNFQVPVPSTRLFSKVIVRLLADLSTAPQNDMVANQIV